DRAGGRAIDELELAGRGASIAGVGVPIVALLTTARLDDPVAAAGCLARRRTVRVVRDHVAGRVPSRIAFLDACFDPAVSARGFETLIRAPSRRAIGWAVVAGLPVLDLPVTALVGGAVGDGRQLVAGLRGARDHAIGERSAAPDVGAVQAPARL